MQKRTFKTEKVVEKQLAFAIERGNKRQQVVGLLENQESDLSEPSATVFTDSFNSNNFEDGGGGGEIMRQKFTTQKLENQG